MEAAHSRSDKKVSNIEDFVCKATAHAVSSAKHRSASIREALSKRELWDYRLNGGHLPVMLDKHQVCKVCSIMKTVAKLAKIWWSCPP